MQSLRQYAAGKKIKSWRFSLKAINSWAKLRALYSARGNRL